MRYTLSRDPMRPRHLKVVFAFTAEGDRTPLALPQWRPGRYEQGNFVRNMVQLEARQEDGTFLDPEPVGVAAWEIKHPPGVEVRISYSYFANQADAGACWVDEDLFYVNPVHCSMYIPGRESRPCTVQILEDDPTVLALPRDAEGNYAADSFDQWADSPLMASSHLDHLHWEEEGHRFELWMYGTSLPEGALGAQIRRDLMAFTREQIATVGAFPVPEFKWMLLALPHTCYHGVEHLRSTVLALGPSDQIWSHLYKEFLGVASHELFHCWNIKSFRPKGMQKYRYEGLMYSRLGYIYEGFTTYYGDLFLVRSGCLTWEEYLEEINAYLYRHSENYGRYNHSLHQSSIDTWVDGYHSGNSAPHRRVSIYAEGMLQALLLDLTLRKQFAENPHNPANSVPNLDHLIRHWWHLFTQNPDFDGYTEEELIQWLDQEAPKQASDPMWQHYFTTHFGRPLSLELPLSKALEHVGCSLQAIPCEDEVKSSLGLVVNWNRALPQVESSVADSPSARAGMGPGDRWLAWQLYVGTEDATTSQSWILTPESANLIRHAAHPEQQQSLAQEILVQEVQVACPGLLPHQPPGYQTHERVLPVSMSGTCLAVLTLNPLGLIRLHCMVPDGARRYYQTYRVRSQENPGAEALTARKAWISSVRLATSQP